MLNDLTSQHCVPCEGGTAPLTLEEEAPYLESVPQWKIAREGTHMITREFVLADFQAALDLVNRIGAIAEYENHHPNISLYNYKNVRVELFTHAIGGLSVNDFIMAAKIDEITP